MISWKRVPAMFLAVALLLAGTLLGLGWQLVRQDRGGASLALWRRPGERVVALLAGPKWLESQLDRLSAALAGQGVAIGLTDPEGHTVFGPRPAGAVGQSVRLAWSLRMSRS